MKIKEPFTPLMKQYHQIKLNYQDAVVLFRLGDFYELFGDDAIKCAPILNVVLTKRQGYPMCGVPHHSVNFYVAKLINAGFKVAICEQVEDPSKAKGLVKREVIRLITPGTILEENLLDTHKNNFLLSIFEFNSRSGIYIGIAYIDISTGEFYCSEFSDDLKFTKIQSELSRIKPKELLIPQSTEKLRFITDGILVNKIDDYYFSYQYAEEKIKEVLKVNSLMSLGLQDKRYSISACGAILSYLEKTQKNIVGTLNKIRFYTTEEYMMLDDSAIRNLELIEGLYTRSRENSLLEILDKTSTVLGARLLRKYLLRPLTNIKEINQRLDTVEFFITDGVLRRQLKDKIKSIRDMERIISRISYGLVTPPEVVILKDSLKIIPEIVKEIKQTITNYTSPPEKILDILNKLSPELESDSLDNLINLIEKSITDDPPTNIHKTGVIREGYNPQLDELRNLVADTRNYIASLEQKERIRTGIASLKIGYTSTFGYYIEVTKPNLQFVPKEYIRKQTLTNAERFVTPELKEYEDKVLSAEEKILNLEIEIFNEIKNEILNYTNKIKDISTAIAELDVYISFADVAVENNYIRPIITDDYTLYIKDGRHPVVEKKLKGKTFVPNDFFLDGQNKQILILTGPNMSGKSTYLKQIALIVIMAQIGAFVPASETKISIVDRIFTRMGSAEDIAGGASTFMIEMQEVANIINNSTPKSLLVMDEVGRGTSTYDGISIAWATVEYLLKKNNMEYGPKVIFATHYFELTELSELSPVILNMNVAVREYKDEIIFLHKVVPGPSDRSYGIHVAKLAGLPEGLIRRAKSILENLQSQRERKQIPKVQQEELSFIEESWIVEEIKKIDINNLTPLDALNLLHQLKKKIS